MVTLALALGALALIVTPASANEVHSLLYQLHFAGPQNLSGQTSPTAFGVAVDNSSGSSAGDVYVSHTSHAEFQAITLAGSPTGGSFSLGFESCTTSGLAVAPTESKPSGAEVKAALEPCVGAGKLFVERTETSSGAVYSVFFNGFPETNVTQLSCDASGLEPHGTATCTVETIAEGTPNAVAKFSPGASSASFLCQITGRGSLAPEAAAECDASAPGPGAFQAPRGLAVDPSSGLLYAIDAARHHVYQFESNGHYTGKSLELGTPSQPHEVDHLAVSGSSGDVFLTDKTNNRVLEWDPATNALSTFSTGADTPAGEFKFTQRTTLESGGGIAVDNSSDPNAGDIYVADSRHKVVDRFSPAGAYQCQITGLGSASTSSSECSKALPGNPEGAFVNPGPLAVDPSNGHLYVGDETHSVVEFTAASDFLDALSSNSGDKVGVPYGLAISAASGDLFVASSYGPDELYVYGPDAPIVATGHPTSVATTSATLQGTVNPISIEVSGCRFEYLEAAKYEVEASEPFASAQTAPCEVEGGGSIGSGTSPVSVHASVSLATNTAYVYRLQAENARAASSGKAVLFGPPGAKTEAATQLTQSSATLNGAVEPSDIPTTYQLEWGTQKEFEEGKYGHVEPEPAASAGEGSGEVQVSQGLTGLQLGATYHYRITATNAIGTYHGADRSFTTLPALLIDAQPAASIEDHTAILQAYVNPLGQALTKCSFSYVDAAHYEPAAPDPYAAGQSLPCEGALASGSSPSLAEAKLEGLAPQTEYHYRLIAENASGKLEGPDEPLSTEPAPGSCPNEARREEQGKDALRLPQCRAYEQVSPEEKGASPVEGALFDVAPSGERVVFSDRGVFAGTASTPYPFLPYIAERGAEGWQTTGLNPNPASLGAAQVFQGNSPAFNFSADLGRSVWQANYGNGVDWIFPTAAFLTREADGSFVKATPTIEALGTPSVEVAGGPSEFVVSEGFSKLLFASQYPVNALDGLGLKLPRLYEVEGFGAPSSTLRLASVDAQGAPMAPCQTELPNENIRLGGRAGSYDPRARAGVMPPPTQGLYAVSADGSHVYFTAETHADRCRIETYLRLKGTETVEISRPAPNQQCTTPSCLIAPTPPGAFIGASADGSRAFFASGGQLTDEAPQGTASSLYMYDEGKPSGHHLLDLSAGDASGSGPGVRFVLDSAKDGSRVYFVAAGLLTEEPNSLGQRAQPGAENLYVYDTGTERVSFIADLAGTDEIVTTKGRSAQFSLTPDGRYLLFATGEQLVPGDENEGADLYRYDAQTGALARVSVGHNGEDQNGNGGGQAALLSFPGHSQASPESFAASAQQSQFAADGQTVVFNTARPLQQGDENGKVDLYEWHQGQVSLLTAATKTDRQRYGFLSASGRDIVFTSIEELILGDKDGLNDVYDARIGGGFRVSIPPPICTSAETCHGEPTHEKPPVPRPHIEGTGNEHQCHRGFVKRHGKCVKVRKKKRHRHGRHPHKRGRVNARSNRYNPGGGK